MPTLTVRHLFAGDAEPVPPRSNTLKGIAFGVALGAILTFAAMRAPSPTPGPRPGPPPAPSPAIAGKLHATLILDRSRTTPDQAAFARALIQGGVLGPDVVPRRYYSDQAEVAAYGLTPYATTIPTLIVQPDADPDGKAPVIFQTSSISTDMVKAEIARLRGGR